MDSVRLSEPNLKEQMCQEGKISGIGLNWRGWSSLLIRAPINQEIKELCKAVLLVEVMLVCSGVGREGTSREMRDQLSHCVDSSKIRS